MEETDWLDRVDSDGNSNRKYLIKTIFYGIMVFICGMMFSWATGGDSNGETVGVGNYWVIDREIDEDELVVGEDYYFSSYWDNGDPFGDKRITKVRCLSIVDGYILLMETKYLKYLPKGYMERDYKPRVDFTHSYKLSSYLEDFRKIGKAPVEKVEVEESVIEVEQDDEFENDSWE